MMSEDDEYRSYLEFRNRPVGRLGALIGAVDAGSSSVRFLVFVASTGELVTYHQVPLENERRPDCLVARVVECIDATVSNLTKLDVDPSDVLAIGLSSHRGSAFAWNNVTGAPLCLETRDDTEGLQQVADSLLATRRNLSPPHVKRMSGVPVSAHFAAVKYRWMVKDVPEVKKSLAENTLCLGTADAFLLRSLTTGSHRGAKGAEEVPLHATDVTHAALTGLMNLETLEWDPKLCQYYGVPLYALPKIRSCSEVYGTLGVSQLRGVPISGCIGDQQAALVGQNCLRPGQAVTTLGSGSFTVYNAGPRIVDSASGLVATVAYQLGPKADPVYALEGGSVAMAGAAVDWLKSNLGLLEETSQVEACASQVQSSQDLHFVPAFNGHQCPRWMSSSRGLILGLNQRTTKSHLCRAALNAVAFTTREILDAMQSDSQIGLSTLLVDGGMSSNNLLLQILADNLGIPVLRPSMPETSALGAAIVAGCANGVKVWDIRASIHSSMDKFLPRLTADERDVLYERWQKAVEVSIFWGDGSSQASPEDADGGCNFTQIDGLRVATRRSLSSTDKDHRLRASLPFTLFAFTSFLIWKIACIRSQSS